MLEETLLDGEARSFLQALPLADRIAMERSNLTFRTLDDLRSYHAAMLSNLDAVLYQRLPDPAIPSNAALDPLDAE